MKARVFAVAVAVGGLPALVAAQGAMGGMQSPVADALRANEQRSAQNLVAAAEEMPADKYGYKPTPAQMSFAKVVVHLAEGNDYLCGTIGGVKAPERAKVDTADTKDKLVARLRETFQFCETALAKVDDSKLAEQLPFFGGRPMSRAGVILVTVGDWADHYSQAANYLRLNGHLPPTAKRPTP
ncbi:MAG TPA: DinB family protein [Gemmatimonadales bacterium]|nr:DinB family protein [Gemmatimonadales bacterium]